MFGHQNIVYKNGLYAEAKGSAGFIIPEDFMTSEGIIHTCKYRRSHWLKHITGIDYSRGLTI